MSIENMNNAASEIRSAHSSDLKNFDPDKRLDISERAEKNENKIDVFDPDKRIEKTDIQGGKYADLKKADNLDGKEIHHTPADSANHMDTKEGPAIIMDKADHMQTASWGNSKEAREYRAKQEKLVSDGKFLEAFEMDVADIKSKFGDKYDQAINEAREYVNKIEQGGKV